MSTQNPINRQDDVFSISNPRLLSAVYFSLLAIIVTIAIDTAIYALGMEQFLPISTEIFLAVIIAACFGALFGERIVFSEPPYHKHTFFWAFLMVIAAFPFYSLGFFFLLQHYHNALFAHATFLHLIHLYLLVLLYSFILAGVWLAILAGFAAIYLRKHLVYYIVQSLNQRRKRDDVANLANNMDNTKQHK